MSLGETIARRLTYPLHEGLLGRPTLDVMAQLQDLASGTPEDLESEVQRRTRALLSFARVRLPYYAAAFRQYGVDVRAADVVAELRKLPVLDKVDVRAHAPNMTWTAVPGGLQPHASGGTTGDTLRFFVDRIRQAEDRGARLFMQSLFGVRPGDRRLHLWGSPIEGRRAWLRRWRDRLLNEELLDAFDLSPARLAAHAARIVRFAPRVIYGYPTAVALLARHMRDRCGALAMPWLRLVVLTGEEVTADQIADVRATFSCAVAAEYGNREVGLIAHDCPQGNMHILAPHVHVDICLAGSVAPAARCGEIVCTTLNTRGQPFLRYRVGDVGRLRGERCPCGLPFPLLSLEGGKVTGLIALPDGRLCHGAITSHVLRDEPGIVAFKTYQHALLELEVLLVVDEHFDAATTARVRARYQALFGRPVHVTFRFVDALPPDPSGKRRYVVSEVAPGVLRGADRLVPPVDATRV